MIILTVLSVLHFALKPVLFVFVIQPIRYEVCCCPGDPGVFHSRFVNRRDTCFKKMCFYSRNCELIWPCEYFLHGGNADAELF